MNEAVRIKVGFAPQPGPQQAFIESPVDITVYGGARGGGKTYATLGEWFLHAEKHGDHARGLMIRKTREDLKDTIAVAETMYAGSARWVDKGSYFRFTSGARLYCAYLENEADAEHYQGWSLTRVYIEELTQFLTSAPVLRLLATLRSAHGVRCQMRCTCNPGGPGHNWVKEWIIDHGNCTVVTDADTGLKRVFIQSKLTDNPKLLEADPDYIAKLRSVGSPQLIEAWLEGNWDIIEGAFFPEFDKRRHVIAPFAIPHEWTRFRAMDWGSARPFSLGWYAVVQETMIRNDVVIPRGALIRYREWYGTVQGKTNTGLKLPAEEVARGIVARETNGSREEINYGIIDPAAYAVISGPSIAETLQRHGAHFRRADNTRTSHGKRMGGWDQVRTRLKGNEDGDAMLFIFSTGVHLIRTLPIMQHDVANLEDLDTDAEDHAVDELRYACMSRPYIARLDERRDKNPLLVANAFRLNDLD